MTAEEIKSKFELAAALSLLCVVLCDAAGSYKIPLLHETSVDTANN